jgi:hypothetical protein
MLVFAAGLLGMSGDFQTVLALPIAVQEIVMAIGLILKGFNSSAIASSSLKEPASHATAKTWRASLK